MPAAYPKSADVIMLLKDLEISTPSALRLDNLLQQAIAQFERRTGWMPFLATDGTRFFDPDGSHNVQLDAGLLSATSVVFNGRTLVAGNDYWLKPSNIAPYQWIRFAQTLSGKPQSIVVTGSWGFSTTIPGDVYQCIIRLAALPILADHLTSVTGGAVQWSEGSASEEFGEQPLLGVFREWHDYTDLVVSAYKRVTVGL